METMDCYLYKGLGGVTYQWASSRLFIPRGDNVSSPGGYFWEFLVGVCHAVPQILIRFETKKCNFPRPFSD